MTDTMTPLDVTSDALDRLVLDVADELFQDADRFSLLDEHELRRFSRNACLLSRCAHAMQRLHEKDGGARAYAHKIADLGLDNAEAAPDA